ncbi:MAG TPA: hypothetical protein VES66_01995 [Terriglobales bacterium]|nr:hypothetical protein [Terriglobales bacterium]
MGTHIIWRNPSPPPKKQFKLRRVAGSGPATVYQVASPSYQRPFELIRTAVVRAGRMAARKKAETSLASPGAELVSARW